MMSSKSRARNLALLGGLGATAMMAMGRRKKDEDKEDKKTSITAPAAPAGPQTYADMPRGEKVLSEAGEDSGFRRNPETGDLYRDVLGNRPTRNMDPGYSNLYKRGGKVKKMAAGGKIKSASARADGCAQRGKTRGKMV